MTVITALSDVSKLLIEHRKSIGLEQSDMYMRIGMKQQQYQRIEAGSDVKLSTLLRVLEGLNLELSIESAEPKQRADEAQLEGSAALEDDSDDIDFWLNNGE